MCLLRIVLPLTPPPRLSMHASRAAQTDNYVVKFPLGADAAQGASLLSALMLINLIFFERRANQK